MGFPVKRILVISSSPNEDGLTAACAASAVRGIERAGKQADCVNLNKRDIQSCMACGNGWGICRNTHTCCIEDDFVDIQKQIETADAVVIITPVYWWDVSESAKRFLDRLRRCEAIKQIVNDGSVSILTGKPVVLAAAAGGSGNGTTGCMQQLDNYCKHMSADVRDRISVTRRSRRYKLAAIEEACFEAAQ